MAQIHKLKDRETGKTLYPETVCGAITDFDSRMEAERQKTDDALSKKVGAVAGKGLSTNDYTNDDKAKLTALPNKSELDSSLGAKLDKSKWDEEHGQFTVVDKYINIAGRLASTVNARATEFICLNYKYDIKTDAKSYVDTVYVITFYDSAGKRIKGYRTQDLTYGEDGFATLTPSEFPAGAAYIRLSCFAKSYSGFTWSNGPTQEAREGAVSEAIQAAVLQSLIDRAKAAGAEYNKATGFFKYSLLTDITADEMEIMLAHINEIFLPGGTKMDKLNARTNIVTASTFPAGWGIGFANIDGVCTLNTYIEVLNIGDIAVIKGSRLSCFAYKCPKLHTITGEIDLGELTQPLSSAFTHSAKLQEVRLRSTKISLNFKDCPLLSLASLQYLVTNAANTSAITVTVHPEVYAKLTDDSNAEWNAVLTSAEAKQITFATTN